MENPQHSWNSKSWTTILKSKVKGRKEQSWEVEPVDHSWDSFLGFYLMWQILISCAYISQFFRPSIISTCIFTILKRNYVQLTVLTFKSSLMVQITVRKEKGQREKSALCPFYSHFKWNSVKWLFPSNQSNRSYSKNSLSTYIRIVFTNDYILCVPLTIKVKYDY